MTMHLVCYFATNKYFNLDLSADICTNTECIADLDMLNSAWRFNFRLELISANDTYDTAGYHI